MSLSSSSDEYRGSTTEEEEDLANCLILLAQGQLREPAPKLLQPDHLHHQQQQQQQDSTIVYNKFNSGRIMEAGSTYIYECKTCNRTFPSFQALGGHRASHKKPKTTIGLLDEKEGQQFIKTNNISSLSLQLTLGGHMRRHRGSIGSNRNITAASTALSLKVTTPMEQPQQPKKPKNVLSLDLDLNLPAPDDDHREQKLPFASKQQQQEAALVFSAPTLVDCHY
ncbi:Cupredoxin superfamily protein [Hibiscus syriacus]|uniref:Cupredoxin superfamily protein n=1 Tax=Hibiscus syriacus TaxID=106335 RepID=A0A6A2XLH5_HIBSY|nr:Cupredoxin superfamily protein [Hibiscus syriacus]